MTKLIVFAIAGAVIGVVLAIAYALGYDSMHAIPSEDETGRAREPRKG